MARWLVAVALAAAAFAFAGLAVAASSFPDAVGDNNEAPDLRSVTLSEETAGTISVAVAVGNYESLPPDSWINIWFDLDSNPSTGYDGDEALVQYSSNGALAFYRWDGSVLLSRAVTGMTSSFASGVLTVTAPKEALDSATAFGVLAIASRSQLVAGLKFIASDSAPDRGRSAYAGPAQMAFTDLADDHDSAPDITSAQVSDAKNGWISIALSTPNYAKLPTDALLVVSIDRDNRAGTGDAAGTDVLITAADGEILLQRWDSKAQDWVDDTAPTRARMRSSANVVTFDIHGSELDYTPAFGFAVVAFDVDLEAETVRAVDVVPDSRRFYKYRLANRPALVLTSTRLFATPTRPTPGKRFTVSLGVRRSDTGSAITSGTVACRVLVGKKRVPAKGSVAGGNARCSFVVPAGTSGAALRGTITIRSDGKSVTKQFAYAIR